ncbi:MAG: hypothetical protein OCD76_20275 [Reichenbachiella sp.]
MIKHLVVVLVCLLTLSCSSKEDKLRKPIEDLSTKWINLLEKVVLLENDLDKEVENWEGMYEGMYISGERLDTMSLDTKYAMNQLKLECLGHGDVYYTIKAEVDASLQDIELEGEGVQELMLGLDRHQLTEDDSVEFNIEKLNGLISKVAIDIDNFASRLDSTKVQCVLTCSKYAKIQTN